MNFHLGDWLFSEDSATFSNYTVDKSVGYQLGTPILFETNDWLSKARVVAIVVQVLLLINLIISTVAAFWFQWTTSRFWPLINAL